MLKNNIFISLILFLGVVLIIPQSEATVLWDGSFQLTDEWGGEHDDPFGNYTTSCLLRNDSLVTMEAINRSGGVMGKFTVKDGDVCHSTVSYRAHLQQQNPELGLGYPPYQELWYGWSEMMATDFPGQDWTGLRGAETEHYYVSKPGNLGSGEIRQLFADASDFTTMRIWMVRDPSNSDTYYELMTGYQKGIWHDWLWHIKWESDDETGYIEVYHKYENESTYDLLVSEYNINTLKNLTIYGYPDDPMISKMGLYVGDSYTDDAIMYFMDYKIGTTKEDVQYSDAEEGGTTPIITNWENNKTDNTNLDISINISESILFNATADQSITTWNWYKDDVDQSNNYDNITLSWNEAGEKTVFVSGTNANGTSNSITWNVLVGWTNMSDYNFMLDRNSGYIKLPDNVSNGLILFHKMSGISGVKSYDMNLTSDNNGTLTNMNVRLDNGSSGWNSSGKYDNGISFDGTNDYIQTTSNELKTANNFTISTWFKADSTTSRQHLIWEGTTGDGWGENLESPVPEMHISIGDYVGGESLNVLSFFLGDVDKSVSEDVLSINTSFTDTTNWNFVTVTVSNLSTSPSAEMFLNGVSVGTDTGTTTRTNRSEWGTNLRFGRPGASTRYFDGIGDEVRVYNRVLTSAEINQTMTNTMSKSDYVKVWYISTSYEAYQLTVNSTFQTNSNISVQYVENGSSPSGFLSPENVTTNNTWSLSPEYLNTDGYIWLFGNGTATPSVSLITFSTQEKVEVDVVCNGWCYLSMNYTNKTLSELSETVSNDIVLGAYNSTSQRYTLHRPSKTLNSDYNVTQGWGYSIYFSESTEVNITIPETIPEITLLTGWNLVGHLSISNTTITDILTDIGSNATIGCYKETCTNATVIPAMESVMIYVTDNTIWDGS